MEIIRELIDSIREDAPVRDILIGAHWTAVRSRFCGMASTVMNLKPHGEECVADAGELHRKSALQLAQYLLSKNVLEASIGLAALNSLMEVKTDTLTDINAFRIVAQKGVNKHVAIFGHFPYLTEIKKTARRITVFELSPIGDEVPFEQVPIVLPDADVVAITSNSIINHTLDSILPHLRKDAFSILVGPSTPLCPLLFNYGFEMLAGVQIEDEIALFRTIGQAAIFRQVRGAKLVTLAAELFNKT